jgi:hypothetical protein
MTPNPIEMDVVNSGPTKEKKAKMDKQPWWMETAKQLGMPTVFLLLLLWMVYEGGKWTGNNVIAPIAKKQIEFIEKASVMTDQMSRTIDSIDHRMEESARSIKATAESLMLLDESVEINYDLLNRHTQETQEQTRILKSIDESLKDNCPK